LLQFTVRCKSTLLKDFKLLLYTASQEFWVGGAYKAPEGREKEGHWEWIGIIPDPKKPSAGLPFNDFINQKFDKDGPPKSTESRAFVYVKNRHHGGLSYANESEENRCVCEVI
jgi:hypothetical protein